MRIEAERCRDFEWSSKREWLVADGAGGYAMGTVAGVNTRRYHGLLIAALRPPADRYLLLSRFEEVVEPDLALATAQYPGALAPQGFSRLLEFRLEPDPVWRFDLGGGATLEKRLSMAAQAVIVEYRLSRAGALLVSPFLAFRDHHALTHANAALDGSIGDDLSVRPYPSLPPLRFFATPRPALRRDGGWYFNHEYLAELDRGLEFREDLWKAGTFRFALQAGETARIVATLRDAPPEATIPPPAQSDRPPPYESYDSYDSPGRGRSDCPFAVSGPTVIAGYPWFTDWGRDTMISLPGLLLTRGELDLVRGILRRFLAHLDRGLIPNRFPDRSGDPPETNTADATLLLFRAVQAYLDGGGARTFLRDEVYPAAKEIVRWHRAGTRHGIRVDPADHLLAAGEPGLALTWMDARVGGAPVTPRIGKPVEINALWVNALLLLSRWGRELGDEPEASEAAVEAEMAQGSLRRAFWNPARGCLFDTIGPNDPALRPNQLFAVPLLPPEQRKSVVRVVSETLLTPFGLRTLAPGEPGYTPRYRGGPAERDRAYHQGTVWPWLLGPYVDAYLSAFGRTPRTLAHCRALLEPLRRHQREDTCLGSVSELFDADPPHAPGGAPAQAWSVAELQRLTSLLAAG